MGRTAQRSRLGFKLSFHGITHATVLHVYKAEGGQAIKIPPVERMTSFHMSRNINGRGQSLEESGHSVKIKVGHLMLRAKTRSETKGCPSA